MKKIIAKDLLDIKAVFLRPNEPFTWASGIKSPIYCDNRLTLSYPKVRKDVEQGLAQLVKDNFPDAECLMGTATAGIAHATLAADILISTGGSSLECVEALREAGCEVLGLIAIFTYGLDKATVNFENAHCPFVTLSNYDTLIEVAKEHDYIKHEDMEKLKAWKVDPSDESWMDK